MSNRQKNNILNPVIDYVCNNFDIITKVISGNYTFKKFSDGIFKSLAFFNYADKEQPQKYAELFKIDYEDLEKWTKEKMFNYNPSGYYYHKIFPWYSKHLYYLDDNVNKKFSELHSRERDEIKRQFRVLIGMYEKCYWLDRNDLHVGLLAGLRLLINDNLNKKEPINTFVDSKYKLLLTYPWKKQKKTMVKLDQEQRSKILDLAEIHRCLVHHKLSLDLYQDLFWLLQGNTPNLIYSIPRYDILKEKVHFAVSYHDYIENVKIDPTSGVIDQIGVNFFSTFEDISKRCNNLQKVWLIKDCLGSYIQYGTIRIKIKKRSTIIEHLNENKEILETEILVDNAIIRGLKADMDNESVKNKVKYEKPLDPMQAVHNHIRGCYKWIRSKRKLSADGAVEELKNILKTSGFVVPILDFHNFINRLSG